MPVGKSAVVQIAIILGALAVITGGIMVYQFTSDGMTYQVYLEEFTKTGDDIKGTVRIVVTNDNDFAVGISNIVAEISDPETGSVFYVYTDYPGARIEPGETFSDEISFTIQYSVIPEDSIKVKLTADLEWNGEQSSIVKEKIITISWSAMALLVT